MARVSVVIPVAPGRGAEIVDSLSLGSFRDYEIIVKEGLNPSRNRNDGISESSGEIIAILDDDAYADKNLLLNAVRFFDRYKDIDIVGGPQLSPAGEGWFARVSGYAMRSFFGSFTMSKRYSVSEFCLDADENSLTSANMFIRKKSIARIEVNKKNWIFDERLFPGEDPEFFFRAKKSGLKIAYNPELVVYHKRRADLFGFLKQFYSYGKVRALKEKICGRRVPLVHFIPSLFFIYVILFLGLFWISRLAFIPILAYILIALVFGFYEAGRNSDFFALFAVPFLYFLMHISYGIGFIRGIWWKGRI